MRVAHTVRTRVEGPGLRLAIWVQGCTIRCKGCCNPELFSARGGRDLSVEALLSLAEGCEGITLLGGEPLEQPHAVVALSRAARSRGLSVWLFTGMVREDLPEAWLAHVDVLVDGPYDHQRPDPTRRWVGSTNQRMHFLTARYRPTDPTWTAPREVELRLDAGELTIVGWPT